jgi:hypothetical protein
MDRPEENPRIGDRVPLNRARPDRPYDRFHETSLAQPGGALGTGRSRRDAAEAADGAVLPRRAGGEARLLDDVGLGQLSLDRRAESLANAR